VSARRPLKFGVTSRLAVIAGIVTFAVLAGTGTSYALWSATAQVSSTAKAATVSLTQTVAPSSTLGVTYTSSLLAAAGAVTVTNTGTRSSAWSLGVTGASTNSTTFPGLVGLSMGIVSATSGCTTSTTLTSPVTGVFGSSAVSIAGTVAAGASVIVCLKTSITAANVAANVSKSVVATVTSTVTAGTWSATSPAATFTQQTPAQTTTTVSHTAWYWIKTTLNPVRCVQTEYFRTAAGTPLWQEDCNSIADQEGNRNEYWKFVPTSDGYYRITSRNALTMGWSQAAVGETNQSPRLSETTSTSGQWLLSANSNGTTTFKLRSDLGMCAALTGTSTALMSYLTVIPCVAGNASQQFQIVMLEIVVPPAIVLTCADTDGWNAVLSWPQLSTYKNNVVYRVKIDGTVMTGGYSRATGNDTNLQFSHDNAALYAYGTGTHAIVVEQSVFGGEWTVTGTGTLKIANNAPKLQCH